MVQVQLWSEELETRWTKVNLNQNKPKFWLEPVAVTQVDRIQKRLWLLSVWTSAAWLVIDCQSSVHNSKAPLFLLMLSPPDRKRRNGHLYSGRVSSTHCSLRKHLQIHKKLCCQHHFLFKHSGHHRIENWPASGTEDNEYACFQVILKRKDSLLCSYLWLFKKIGYSSVVLKKIALWWRLSVFEANNQ